MKVYIKWIFADHDYTMTLEYGNVHAVNSFTRWVKDNKRRIEAWHVYSESRGCTDEVLMAIKEIIK